MRAAMKPISTVPRALRTVDVATGEAAVAINQRSDVCAVPAAGVVAEAMVALVLADAALEKFGGDSLAETRRNAQAIWPRWTTLLPALPVTSSEPRREPRALSSSARPARARPPWGGCSPTGSACRSSTPMRSPQRRPASRWPTSSSRTARSGSARWNAQPSRRHSRRRRRSGRSCRRARGRSGARSGHPGRPRSASGSSPSASSCPTRSSGWAWPATGRCSSRRRGPGCRPPCASAHRCTPRSPRLTVDTAERTPDEVAEEVLAWLMPAAVTRIEVRPAGDAPYVVQIGSGLLGEVVGDRPVRQRRHPRRRAASPGSARHRRDAARRTVRGRRRSGGHPARGARR